MKKHLSIFLLLLSLVFSVSAQAQSKLEKNLRTHINYLASDALDGRRTGEKGATVAAGYVANVFSNYKLEQGVVETNEKGKKVKNYLQKFPYISGIELGADNSFSINNSGVNLKSDWMPVGFSPNADISNSQIIFAGYGIASDELKYNDYNGLDANGKIVLVLEGTPDNGNPHSEFSRFNFRAKANIAKSKGAKALLIISGEEKFADDKLAQLDFNQTLGETAIPAIVISRKTAANIFGEKDAGAISNIEKIVAARKDKPENVHLNITYEPKALAQLKINLVQKQAEAFKVIGVIEGRDNVLKNEAIVIGNDGLLLDGVRDDSAAAKAGISAGDKIIKMAGRDINNISDYVFVLGEMKAGEEYEVVVLRGAEKLTLKIVPDARK